MAAESNLYTYNGRPPRPEDKVAIVVAEYNSELTEALYEGARQILNKYNVLNIHKEIVPGAFELVYAADAIARTEQFRAIIACGVVIRGETNHDRYINHAIAQGLIQVGLETKVPVINGVVTTETWNQAAARCGGHVEHKGKGCGVAALKMMDFRRGVAEL